MANVNRPKGFSVSRTMSGSPISGTLRQYPVDAANAVAINPGDAVKLEDDGNVAAITSDSDTLLGVCTGVVVDRAVPNTEHPGYLPALTAGNILIGVGTDLVYTIQEDSVGGSMVAANVGATGNVAIGVGDTTTAGSGHLLDSSSVIANDGTPAVGQLVVLGLVNAPDNELGTNAKWEVRINKSAFALGQSGI